MSSRTDRPTQKPCLGEKKREREKKNYYLKRKLMDQALWQMALIPALRR